nr:NADH dehydrogenase subunit 2 [Potamometra berezowskii]
MIKISTKLIMMITLVLSTLMVISSENWFSTWMGLEINMMSFIPLMEKSKDYYSPESKMTYFLIQSMSSIIFIFMIIMNPMILINEELSSNMCMMIITSSMLMKIGAAPMHMWFINIMAKMSWNNCILLMTWQKIAPIFILSNTMNNNFIIMICSIISAMTGAIGGINQTSIKKMLAFSSVNHLGWMIICMKYDNEMWMKYLMFYSIIILMLTSILNKNSIIYINQMNMNMKTNMEKINMIMLMLSLGGLPPFIGFLPKWLVIQALINTNSIMVLLILMMSSMITLFYYLRMISPTIMTNNTLNKWNINNKNTKSNLVMTMIINMMLPVTTIINMI